jgi:regulator of nucleoside diphosphate kinase
MNKEHFPRDVARLNSTVIVKNLQTNLTMAYTVVAPKDADRRKNKISVLSPIGAALIGLKKGISFSWERLARRKNFLVLEVYNSPSLEKRL